MLSFLQDRSAWRRCCFSSLISSLSQGADWRAVVTRVFSGACLSSSCSRPVLYSLFSVLCCLLCLGPYINVLHAFIYVTYKIMVAYNSYFLLPIIFLSLYYLVETLPLRLGAFFSCVLSVSDVCVCFIPVCCTFEISIYRYII